MDLDEQKGQISHLQMKIYKYSMLDSVSRNTLNLRTEVTQAFVLARAMPYGRWSSRSDMKHITLLFFWFLLCFSLEALTSSSGVELYAYPYPYSYSYSYGEYRSLLI